MRPTWFAYWVVIVLPVALPTWAIDGNRLTYLDEFCDPYYPGLETPKLVTQQWIGEPGVQAVIVLSIDDMRDPAPYERFLRPILDRLKKIDGRAPVSIITNQIDPVDLVSATDFGVGGEKLAAAVRATAGHLANRQIAVTVSFAKLSDIASRTYRAATIRIGLLTVEHQIVAGGLGADAPITEKARAVLILGAR